MKQNNILGGAEAMKKVDHVHGHEAEAQELWEKSEKLRVIKDLKAGKNLDEIMGGLDLSKAFDGKSEELGCSDGRICAHRLGGAGNFILASEGEQAEFIEKNRGKIAEVKSHDGCGAAGIKFNQMREAGLPMPSGVTTADELGKYFSKELAAKLGAEYGHTAAGEMSGPVHGERMIYFDGTGKFNPSAIKELPAGFIMSGSALGLSQDYCEKEMVTLAKIALGDHGFGQRFDQDNPLYIAISAKDKTQLEALKKIAEQAASQLDGRAKVDGFIAK